ncbi:MAG: VanZ family protein [Bacteroidota bacterium]
MSSSSARKIVPTRWRFWLPALFWMALIFLMSHQPGGDSGNLSRLILEYLASWGIDLRAWFGDHAFWVIRKMAHFTEYFILYLLVAIGWGNFARNKWYILGFCMLYAASDEFHQLFIPGRVGDIGDVMIDSTGAFFGLIIIALVRRWKKS